MKEKYITFNLIEKKEKTEVYEVVSYLRGNRLGIIKWYSNWRQYAFFPDSDTVWNVGCLQDVILHIETLMHNRIAVGIKKNLLENKI